MRWRNTEWGMRWRNREWGMRWRKTRGCVGITTFPVNEANSIPFAIPHLLPSFPLSLPHFPPIFFTFSANLCDVISHTTSSVLNSE